MAEGTYIPLRMCAVCREHRPKRELIRLAVSDGAVVADGGGKLAGRGVYVCKSRDCIRLAEKKRIAQRQLKAEPIDGLYGIMEDMI